MMPKPLQLVKPAAPSRPVKEYELKGMYIYGCDTETYSIGGNGLRSIQLAGSSGDEWLITPSTYDDTDENVTADCVDKFLRFLHDPDHINTNTLFVFFNLRFDWSWMYRNFIRGPDDPDDTLKFEYINNGGKLKNGQIRIMEGPNQVYRIDLRVNKHRVVFLDIHNFLTTMNLADSCDAFEVQQKMALGSKRFEKSMPEGDEREYSIQDVRCTRDLYLALEKLGVMSEDNVTTIASSSLHDFQLHLKRNLGLTYNQYFYGTDKPDLVKPMTENNEAKMRSSLRGGWVECFRTGYFEHVTHIDARSMHPSMCTLDRHPFGTFYDEPPTGPVPYTYIIFPKGYFRLKEKGIPYVQWRNKEQCLRYSIGEPCKPSEYPTEFMLDGSYCFWEEEWNVCVLNNYDFEPIGDARKYYIRMCKNEGPKPWITEHYKDKRNAPNEGQKQRAKIFINSFYGKQVTNPVGESVKYIYDEQAGWWDREKVTEYDRPVNHLPFGSWIVMMSRVTLMKVALRVGIDKLIYCDTDSLIYEGTPEDAGVEYGKDLRQWGVENGGPVDVITLGPKTYQELTVTGKTITKCAGLSKEVSATIKFGELKDGDVYPVLKARRHPTIDGIMLEETTFKVSGNRSQWSYRL